MGFTALSDFDKEYVALAGPLNGSDTDLLFMGQASMGPAAFSPCLHAFPTPPQILLKRSLPLLPNLEDHPSNPPQVLPPLLMDLDDNMPPLPPDSGSDDTTELSPKAAADLPPPPEEDDLHPLKHRHWEEVILSNDQSGDEYG